jgi:hypothetical protein
MAGSDQRTGPRTVHGLSVSRSTSVGQSPTDSLRTVREPTDRSDGFENVQKLWSVRDLSVICEPKTERFAVCRGGANVERRS